MSQIRVCPTPPQSAVEYPLWNQDRIRVERRSLQEVANGFCHMSHEIARTFHKTHLKAQETIIFNSKFFISCIGAQLSKATLKGQTLYLEDGKEVSVVYWRCGFVPFTC